MITIYKYSLQLLDIQELQIPKNTKILTVQVQDKIICVWIRLDSVDKTEQQIRFHIYGTGQPCAASLNYEYLGTIQKDNFVWHIFFEYL